MSREMTMGEADAWRAGRDAALAEVQRMAAFMRRHNAPDSAALYEVAAEAIAKLTPGGGE